MPDTEYLPSLTDWVERLNRVPRIDGTIKAGRNISTLLLV